jgi:hypothetical protein
MRGGFLGAIRDEQKQGCPDKIAKTGVLRVKSGREKETGPCNALTV